MRSADYWKTRSEQIAKRQHRKADRYAYELGREYGRAMQSIQRDIEAFYGRFAVNNQIDLTEARRLLKSSELAEFKMSLEEFIEKAKDNADGRWTRQLNNVYYRTRVSRLEALQTQIRQQVEMLAASQHTGVQELLGDIYEDTYYRTLFELQKGTGIGASFAKIDKPGLEKVLGTEFAGSNWSARIWADRDKLARELHIQLTQAFIRGDSVDRTVRTVRDRFGVSYSNARRLVQTESAFFTEQATLDSYKASGVVGKYEILATLDNRTSEICQQMDGKVFRISEYEVGVTAPPFHPNCRTTTIPYFDDEDEEDAGERIARNAEGRTYNVPGDMTYGEWKKKYVDSQNYGIMDTNRSIIQKARTSYESWDKRDRKEFADQILAGSGLELKAQVHDIPAYGQCKLDFSGSTMVVKTYELDSKDQRELPYKVKTLFHELFHAKSHGLLHDVKHLGFLEWAYYDDVFAEAFSHYAIKELGIVAEIAPSYAGHLVETLPKLKKLPEFKRASSIADFGEIAYGFRFGENAKATWGDLKKAVGDSSFNLSSYSQSYMQYIKDHAEELIDKIVENMPYNAQFKSYMLADLNSVVANNAENLVGRQKLIFENALIIAMNRLGVKEA